MPCASLITPPVIITPLTDGVPLDPINNGGEDYYSFKVTTNTTAVLFSVTNNNTGGGPFTLVAKYGLPLPSLSSYQFISTSWQTGESILITYQYHAGALTNGTWYLGVVNVSGGMIDYTIGANAYGNVVPPLFLFPTNTTVTNILETVPLAISCVATDLDTPPLPLCVCVGKRAGRIDRLEQCDQLDAQRGARAVHQHGRGQRVERDFQRDEQLYDHRGGIQPAAGVAGHSRINLSSSCPAVAGRDQHGADPDIPVNPLAYALTTTVTGHKCSGH